MGFLDEHPFRFGDPVGRELLAQLMAVYSHQPLVQQFADEAGIPRAGIAWTGRMEDVWPELLRKAAAQRLLRPLIRRIAAHPDSASMDVLQPLLMEPAAVVARRQGVAGDAYGLHLLGGARVPRPFIDRVELRNLLRQFSEPDAERVLVVTGNKRAGKSYSWHLIKHIGDVVGVDPYLIDLALWIGPPMGPSEVMEWLATVLAMEEKPPRETLAQEDAQAWKLRVWFLGQIRRRREVPCWLVVDGLDRAPLTESARRLIIDIVEATKNNEAGELRIALLAGPRPDADDFQVLHDDISPVPLHELRTFFNQASAMTGGGALTDDAFERLLTELFGDSSPPESLCLEQVGPSAARLASTLFFRNGHRRG